MKNTPALPVTQALADFVAKRAAKVRGPGEG